MFSCFVFACVSFHFGFPDFFASTKKREKNRKNKNRVFQKKSTTNFGVSVFPKKMTIFCGRETKHTFYQRKSTKKPVRSAPLTNFILLEQLTIQQQQYNLDSFRFNTLGNWIMFSPVLVAQPTPSHPALCRQDTTSPWSTGFGGNIFCWMLRKNEK